MSLRRSEILDLWESRHGTLSKRWRSEFVADPRTRYLTRLDPSAVRYAIRERKRLDEIVTLATERSNLKLKENPAKVDRARTRSDRSRFAFGHYPHEPSDRNLHRRIGPTQEYTDDL